MDKDSDSNSPGASGTQGPQPSERQSIEASPEAKEALPSIKEASPQVKETSPHAETDSSSADQAQASIQEAQSRAESSKVVKSAGVVSAFTMLSRVLGLVRDMVIAQAFGATAAADAFFVAFKVPNFMRRLFAEGAFAQAFIPVLSEYKAEHPRDMVRLLVSRVAGSLGLGLLGLSVFAVTAAPYLIMVFAPGFISDPPKLQLAGEMLRLTFPYLFLISMTALAGSILNSYGKFAVPAFTPVLLNVCLISSALFLPGMFEQPVMALAWGVLIAGVAQFMFQLPFLARIDMLPAPVVDYKHPGVRKILKLMVPALFGVSVSQINLLLDSILASFLVSGSVSWLYFSDRLVELPLGVIGIALATVILPNLSAKHAEKSKEGFAKTLDWATRVVLLAGVPAALALVVLAEPIIITLFQRGEFDELAVVQTAASLRAYSLGLVAFMLIKVLAPGYFARQDIKTPVRVGIIAMVVNMALNLAFIVPLAHVGLALATSLSAFLNAGMLFLGLRRDGVFEFQAGWLKFLLRLAFASVGMVAVLLWIKESPEVWLDRGTGQRVMWITGLVLAGSGSYFALLFGAGLRFKDLRH